PNKLYLIGAVLSAIALAIWIRHGVIPARFQSARTALARVLCDTLGWVVCGSVAIILLVCSYAQSKRVTEPLEFRSGISIWPTEMLRLNALLLTVHFMMKAFVMLKLNCQEISDRFSLKDPPVKAFFQKFRLGFT